jgi:putative protein kinase ArgK-like GTPase of G3E family
VATRAEGLEELFIEVDRHRRHLEQSGQAGQIAAARLKDEAADLVGEWARAQARRLLERDGDLAERLLHDRLPYAAAEEILTRAGPGLVPEEARSES